LAGISDICRFFLKDLQESFEEKDAEFIDSQRLIL